MRILRLACEPWQTKMLLNVMSQLENKEKVDCHLGILDFYQFVHNVDYINYSNFSSKSVTFHDQNELYLGWQSEFEDLKRLEIVDLESWEQRNCRERSLSEIMMGNALTNQWERDAYWLPVTEYWKKRVLVDTISWCEKLFSDIKPAIVLNIERAELAQSIMDLICRREDVPLLTFIPSRIGERWLLREDFGYGTSKLTKNLISEASKCENVNPQLLNIFQIFGEIHLKVIPRLLVKIEQNSSNLIRNC